MGREERESASTQTDGLCEWTALGDRLQLSQGVRMDSNQQECMRQKHGMIRDLEWSFNAAVEVAADGGVDLTKM